jgi:putative ubiquitin-RnfH superfamily antitoxin RatB of RatAB toxin-antitoxin module
MAALHVEVVYAIGEKADVITLRLPAGASVGDAIAASGLSVEWSAVGVFGRRVTVDTLLSDGDRVELYRPLRNDPKEARRRRARKASR